MSAATAGHVLVVDDEPINLSVTEGLLTPLGFTVDTATDAVAALSAVASRRPDVILLDVMMPGRTGLDLCAELKDRPETAAIPVVLVTALDAAGHRAAGLQVGADDFLCKPIDEAELAVRVRGMTARSRLRARLDRTDAVARGVVPAHHASPTDPTLEVSS